MSFVLNFPLFLIVASLLSSVVSSVLKSFKARVLTLILTFTSVIANILILIYVLNTGQSFTYLMGHFPHPWGNELKIDVLEATVSALFSLVLFLILLGGRQSIDEKLRQDKSNIYYSLCDLIQSALLVLAYTNDIFTGYVFIEICTLASCGILVIRGNGKTTAAAIRYMVFALVGSGLLLFGIVFLYNITGNLLMPNLKESIVYLYSTKQYVLPLLAAMCFITVGIGIKSGLFPFHYWMADTYGTAIPASSGILSGVISKAYIFFLIKLINDVFTPAIFVDSSIANIIFILGAAGVVVGSISATRENHIFKMIAFSSAAQIGYIYMGIGMGTKAAITAAIFQIMAHAITKPALFLSSYYLSIISGNAKKFKNLEGAAKKDPLAGAFFTQGALSMVGIPLTAGFITKFLFGSAAFELSNIKIVIVLVTLVISTILNTIYFTKTIVGIYTTHQEDISFADHTLNYVIAGTSFVVINFALGILSSHFINVITIGINFH